MGDIADMMLDGCLCQGCGVYLGEGDGFPEFCLGCQHEQGVPNKKHPHQTISPLKAPCRYCGKHYKKSGLHAHTMAKHPEVLTNQQTGER